jgi:hypothetical protein
MEYIHDQFLTGQVKCPNTIVLARYKQYMYVDLAYCLVLFTMYIVSIFTVSSSTLIHHCILHLIGTRQQLLIIQQTMIRTNTSKGLRVTRERKVRIITNTNDTYEYIEGATSQQRKKGTNYNKYQ